MSEPTFTDTRDVRIGDTGNFAEHNGNLTPIVIERIVNRGSICVRGTKDYHRQGTLDIKDFIPDKIRKRVELEPTWDE